MAQTVRNLINRSLRKIGARAFGQNVEAEETFEALEEFNDIVAVMAQDNMWNYTVEQSTQAITPAQSIYTVGDGGDYDINRQNEFVSIEVLYNNAWRPVTMYSNDEFVSSIKKATATSTAYPRAFTYFPDFPLGRIEFYPEPNLAIPVRLNYRNMNKIYTLDDVTDLPRQYDAFFVLKLAVKLAAIYGTDPAIVTAIAFDANKVERRIKLQNYQPRLLKTSGRRGSYDVRSNTYL